MKRRLLYKFIKGELSKEKEQQVLYYLNKNPKARKKFSIMKAKYVAESFQVKDNLMSGNFSKKRLILSFYKYAAVAVVLFLSSFFLTDYLKIKDNDHKVEQVVLMTKRGERKIFYLSDSTKVILNANSSLTCLKDFNGSEREVVLKGEAYFDVTHNEKQPFIVKTNNLINIKVLGTAFNVKAYPEDGEIETTLVRGKVKVMEEKDDKTVYLLPSQKATYDKVKDIMIVEKVKPQRFISWKEGRLVYDDTPMSQVIKDLERNFDMDIKVDSKEILDFKYKGVVDNLNLDQVIELLELSSPIKITKHEKSIHMDLK